MNREIFGAMNIPYTAHIHENVVKTKAGDYVQAFRLAGASFKARTMRTSTIGTSG
jgi:type IV secretory pathway VirB4 component